VAEFGQPAALAGTVPVSYSKAIISPPGTAIALSPVEVENEEDVVDVSASRHGDCAY
jgi:hypothetical protein